MSRWSVSLSAVPAEVEALRAAAADGVAELIDQRTALRELGISGERPPLGAPADWRR